MTTEMKSWKLMIAREMDEYDDSWDNIVSCTLTEEDLCEMFDPDFGCTNGKRFTLWTEARVYFPVTYDGAEWVRSVSRNPDGNPTEHVGGG